MEIEDAEKMLEEVRKRKEEERKEDEKRKIAYEEWKRLPLRNRITTEAKEKIYTHQKEALTNKIEKAYPYAIEKTEELWSEYWEMLLDEKIRNIISFLEYKKMIPIEENKTNDKTN